LAPALATSFGVGGSRRIATVVGSSRHADRIDDGGGGFAVGHNNRAADSCIQRLVETQNGEADAAHIDAEEDSGTVVTRTSCSHSPGYADSGGAVSLLFVCHQSHPLSWPAYCSNSDPLELLTFPAPRAASSRTKVHQNSGGRWV
jgi:hypothetical protein